MNRSIQAFAALLVSLAGGMLAATWTSTLPPSRRVSPVAAQARTVPGGMHCSCNPDSLVRLEQGCAHDKTTDELYVCGLSLGKNGTDGKSVITESANGAVAAIIGKVKSLANMASESNIQDWAGQGKNLAAQLESIQLQLPTPVLPDNRSTEQEYAAAERAAAGFDSDGKAFAKYVEPIFDLPLLFSAESVSDALKQIEGQLGFMNKSFERRFRLWLVEAGLHREWDAAEIAQQQKLLAGMQLEVDEECIERWFENFPAPVTQPDNLLNPDAPSDDSSESSRRTILAAAKVLESLSNLLHQTAENLTRHAEQDVAKLHKLKSGIEERR
jgi:hypothetical protein